MPPGRFPVDSDEVILRRTVGHKKDEFFLNRKRIEKSEVVSLLESAGFSKSNPYYIVQQGKVAHLCVMKDRDRLDLLKEVAGTTVYEERRAESIKILQETSNKQDRITEILTFIEERLEELEQEKDELKEYDDLDKRRRALEYHVYDKELSKAQTQLGAMEENQEEQRARQHELYGTLRSAEEKLQTSEEELAALKAVMDRADDRLSGRTEELKVAEVQLSRCDVDVRAAEAAAEAQAQELSKLQAERDDLVALIQQTEKELAAIETQCVGRRAELDAAKDEQAIDHMKIEALYGKQGRGRQFKSAKERDTFLRTQISLVDAQVQEKNAHAAQLTGELQAGRLALSRESALVQEAEAGNRARVAQGEELSRSIEQKLQQRNLLQEKRKQIWRDLDNIAEEVVEARAEQTKGRQMLSSTLPRAVTMGLAAVERIVDDLGISGYHGPLIDNFTLKNEVFRTCVEVAAGNSLFHVVVDDDKIAARLMKELERQRAGRLTFLPLNRLQVENIQYPNSPDVKPLLDIALNYDPEFEPALRHVSVAGNVQCAVCSVFRCVKFDFITLITDLCVLCMF
jgi:structural maintenance of chromosome 3 (chondroitin sulfate proteoglycan 6)